jgi:L-iditol 2-dehydrogenase
MKAVYLSAPGRFSIRDVPDPRLQAPDGVLLEMSGVGICGSDIHYFKSGHIGPQVVQYPFVVGHECAAVVREVGPSVTDLKVGDRVAVDPLVACGECDQCKSGRLNTCRRQQFLGCPGQLEGCMSEYIAMPRACCFPVPEMLSLGAAVLVEPFAIALHAARLAGSLADLDVAVLGAGPIGLCVQAAVKLEGPRSVLITDKLAYRLQVADALGADAAVDVSRSNAVREAARHKPHGFDVVFECCGEPEALDQALELLKPGGTLLIVGIPDVSRVAFDISLLRRKELSIKNVRRQNHQTQRAIDLLASGAVNLDSLVTHHFDFASSQGAFEVVAGYQQGVLKALLHFDQL